MKMKRRLFASPLTWCGIVFALVFLVHSGTLFNRFAFDDKSLIVENGFLKNKTPLSTIFTTNYRAGSGFTGDGLYRPLVMLSYMINARQPLSPFPFHLFNVTVNALNAVLFLILVLCLFNNLPLAVLTSIIFGLHPIHTEAVANIAGRPELMYSAFILGAWIIRERWVYSAKAFPAVIILFLCGMLSKETAVMFPFMIIAYDLVKNRPVFSFKYILQYAIFATVIVAYLVWRWHLLGPTAAGLDPDFVDNPISDAAFLSRTSTAFCVFARCMGLLVAPVILSADYSYNQIPVVDSFFHVLPALGLVLFVSMVGISILYRRYIVIPFSVILILFPYILVSNIVFPVGTIMGERLLYLSAGGIALLSAHGIFLLYNSRRSHRTFAVLVCAAIMAFFSIKTFDRNRSWFDDETLFGTDIKHAPNSVKILCNLGFLTGKSGRIEESMDYFRRALIIRPDYPDALRGYGKRLYDLKRYEESLKYYARAVEADPGDVNGRNDYGIVLGKVGRYDEAEVQYNASIRLNPNNPLPYQEMSGIFIERSQFDKALVNLRKAAELGGDRRIILNNSAVAFFFSGDISSALNTLKEAESAGISLNGELAAAIRAAAYRR